jgi:hypothetical protein
LKDEIVADIEARIAAWTFLPVGKLITFFMLIYEFFNCNENFLFDLSQSDCVNRKWGVHANTAL